MNPLRQSVLLLSLYALFVSVSSRSVHQQVPFANYVVLRWNSANSTAHNNPIFFILPPSLTVESANTIPTLSPPSTSEFSNSIDSAASKPDLHLPLTNHTIVNNSVHIPVSFKTADTFTTDPLPVSTVAEPDSITSPTNNNRLNRVLEEEVINTPSDLKATENSNGPVTNMNSEANKENISTTDNDEGITDNSNHQTESVASNVGHKETSNSEFDLRAELSNSIVKDDLETSSSSNSSGSSTNSSISWRRFFGLKSSKRRRLESSSSSGSVRSASSLSSFLAARSRRIEKTWFPLNVTESLTTDGWPRNEATIIYEVGADSLQNIRRAELSLTVEQPASGRLMPYLLYGKYETFNASVKSAKKYTETTSTFIDLSSLPRHQSSITFNVTNFITDIIGNFRKINVVRVTFFVRRQADFQTNNTLLVTESSPINFHPILAESSMDPPFFQVFYAQE